MNIQVGCCGILQEEQPVPNSQKVFSKEENYSAMGTGQRAN